MRLSTCWQISSVVKPWALITDPFIDVSAIPIILESCPVTTQQSHPCASCSELIVTTSCPVAEELVGHLLTNFQHQF